MPDFVAHIIWHWLFQRYTRYTGLGRVWLHERSAKVVAEQLGGFLLAQDLFVDMACGANVIGILHYIYDYTLHIPSILFVDLACSANVICISLFSDFWEFVFVAKRARFLPQTGRYYVDRNFFSIDFFLIVAGPWLHHLYGLPWRAYDILPVKNK